MLDFDSDTAIKSADRQKILVVDDEPQVCDFLAEALTFFDHSVVTAKSGDEALKYLERQSYSIAIVDMDMPIMDGMELIEIIVGQIDKPPDIIAITGHTMRYKYTDVVAAGAVDFITKPFTIDELEAKVNRIIRERTMRHELERLAVRDHLTGLYNRRFFQKVAKREIVRASRYQTSVFLLYIDIDHFKEYNDTHGHNAGDRALMQLAKILNCSIRNEVDSAFRFGGDEFTVLVTCANGALEKASVQAAKVAHRIREKYNEHGLSPTSLSIGLAIYRNRTGELDEDIKDMVHRADRALYHVKSQLGGDNIYYEEQLEAITVSSQFT